MAEFVQMMKDWRRMCEKNHTDCMRLCPICANPTCCELAEATDEDIRSAEVKIMAWAAENPEPVYPNWSQWLVSIGVIPKEIENCQYRAIIELGLINPIHADIAEKLGIEPKEGT